MGIAVPGSSAFRKRWHFFIQRMVEVVVHPKPGRSLGLGGETFQKGVIDQFHRRSLVSVSILYPFRGGDETVNQDAGK